MQSMKYIYWRDEEMCLGYLEEYPDYWTQGEKMEALEENLRDIYRELVNGSIPFARRVAQLESDMKRRDLICELEKMECVFIHDGAKHDWYHNPRARVSQPVPRYKEIKEYLARHIIKMLKCET